MLAKTTLFTAALLVAVPAAAQDAGRLGSSAFADPYERAYDRFDEGARDGDRALAAYYGYGTYISPFDRDYRWPERIVRDRDGALSYDRDYPYDFRYGGRVASGATVVASSDLAPVIADDEITMENGVRIFRGGGAPRGSFDEPAR